jgi:hypothetical protein
MSGSHLAVIIIPIVTAIALFGWLAAVLWASTHPRYSRNGVPPRTEVAGGAFRAVDGGRQLMPIPEHRPAGVPAPRAAESETEVRSGSSAAVVPEQRPAATQPGYAASSGQPAPGSPPESQPLAGVAGAGHGMERGASAVGRKDLRLVPRRAARPCAAFRSVPLFRSPPYRAEFAGDADAPAAGRRGIGASGQSGRVR